MIDCHAHLAGEDFDSDRDAVRQRARAVGVEAVLVVGEDPADNARVLRVLSEDRVPSRGARLLPCLGFHPDRFADDVVGATLFNQPIVGLTPITLGLPPTTPEDRPFDSVAAAVGENEDARCAAQLFSPEAIWDCLPHDVDPHVDIALPHDLREDLIKLVPPDLIVLLDILVGWRIPLLGMRYGLELNYKTKQ